MLTLLADLGDALRLQAGYNAATLVEWTDHLTDEKKIIWATECTPEHPARFAFESCGYTILDVHPDWQWAWDERRELFRYLEQMSEGKARLKKLAQLEHDVHIVLASPLTCASIHSADSLDRWEAFHLASEAYLEEGIGTAHRKRRLDELARQLADHTGVALVAWDDLSDLLKRLPHARLPEPQGFVPGPSSRLRSLCDLALRLEGEHDWGHLCDMLLGEVGDAITPRAELLYAVSGVYLGAGDVSSARSLLQQAETKLDGVSHTIIGLIYARLGLVCDCLGDRPAAILAYQKTLEQTASQVALECARLGLEQPFTLEDGPNVGI
ncbi:MAG: hypothetical protein U0Z75_04020 [Deinococcaceae bacterium]